MGPWTLSCVVLCILVARHTDAGVIQTPRHKVTEMGQTVTLNCEPISGHTDLFWYRQTTVQGLELLTYFRSRSPMDEGVMPKDRFFAEMPTGSPSTLRIQPTEPKDSAVYLCASSVATALQNQPLPVQKLSCFPFSLQLLAVVSKVIHAPISA
ncbi:T-cell receptor beta chain V region YT35 [Tupaia chinensis]|nr:T-cell receptor beta chain V region YT35 [Tupaia chinensis]